MKALDLLETLHEQCHFQTREGKKVGVASKSELRRWFNNGAVIINGAKASMNDELTMPVKSLVLFPKHPVTLA